MGNRSCQQFCQDLKKDQANQNELQCVDPNKISKQTNEDKIQPIEFDDPDEIQAEPQSNKINQFQTLQSNFVNETRIKNQLRTSQKLKQINQDEKQDQEIQANSAQKLVVVKASKFSKDINIEEFSNYERINVPFQIIYMSLSQSLIDKISKIDRTFFQKNLSIKTNISKNWYLLEQGCYANFIKQDKSGVLISSNKFYNGSLKSIKQKTTKVYIPEGEGIYIAQNLIYNGSFIEGLAFGKGRYTCQDAVYEGSWENGSFLKGTINHKLYTFSGFFKNNKPTGKGKLHFKVSNTIYEGNFIQGKFEDKQGQYKCANYTYTGGFKNGKKNGYGVLIQSEKQSSNSKKYKPPLNLRGQWEDDQFIMK